MTTVNMELPILLINTNWGDIYIMIAVNRTFVVLIDLVWHPISLWKRDQRLTKTSNVTRNRRMDSLTALSKASLPDESPTITRDDDPSWQHDNP